MNIKTKRRCKKGFRRYPPKTGTCLSTRRIKRFRCPSGYVQKPPKSRTCQQKPILLSIVSYDKYRVTSSAMNYLTKHVLHASAINIRKRAYERDLCIPLEKYPNDADMKHYLMNEILETAMSHEKKPVISLEAVKHAVSDDFEFALLLN